MPDKFIVPERVTREAYIDLLEQLEATEQRLAREISEHADAQAEYRRLVEQFEASDRALADAVWDGQRQGFQAVREAISGRIAAPLVDEIMEDAEIILSASNPATKNYDERYRPTSEEEMRDWNEHVEQTWLSEDSDPASESEGEVSLVGAEGSHPRRLAGSGSRSETSEWRGVYPGMCIDPEVCRGFTHCPRNYSCCE